MVETFDMLSSIFNNRLFHIDDESIRKECSFFRDAQCPDSELVHLDIDSNSPPAHLLEGLNLAIETTMTC